MFTKSTAIVTGGFTALVALTLLQAQGPLDPAAGPAPTMKTLDQIYDASGDRRIPVSAGMTITEPGSYYLANDLEVTSAQVIEIESSNVTLDLNGYTIRSTGFFGGFTKLIELGGTGTPYENVCIKNGSLHGPANRGINIADVENLTIENVTFKGFTDGAIVAFDNFDPAPNVRVEKCQIIGGGIRLGATSSALLKDCTLNGEGINGHGIRIIMGIVDESHSVQISGCRVTGYGQTGILSTSGMIVDRCKVSACAGGGINVGVGSLVESCVATANETVGIEVGSGSVVKDCVAYRNTESDSAILLNVGSSAVGCVVYNNQNSDAPASGIEGSFGCSVIDCTVRGSDQSSGTISRTTGAISLASGGMVRGCTISSNAGIGILATGAENRIEGNHVRANVGGGIHVQGTENIVMRNTCVDNQSSNYNFVAGNTYGPIINNLGDVSASPAVIGNSATSTMSTVDPWANSAQ